MAQSMSPGVKTLIVVALIGAAGTIAAAVIAILPDLMADSDPTSSPSPSAIASQTLDTPTPTASASSPSTPPSPTPVTLSFLDRISGGWTLQSWNEVTGPVTLGVEVLNGHLDVAPTGASNEGQAIWRMDIQEVNEPTSPQPAITCGGRATLDQTIEGVPGAPPNDAKDFTDDLDSINGTSTGERVLFRTFCGWSLFDTQAPFSVLLDGIPSEPATRMEMRNDKGTFVWFR